MIRHGKGTKVLGKYTRGGKEGSILSPKKVQAVHGLGYPIPYRGSPLPIPHSPAPGSAGVCSPSAGDWESQEEPSGSQQGAGRNRWAGGRWAGPREAAAVAGLPESTEPAALGGDPLARLEKTPLQLRARHPVPWALRPHPERFCAAPIPGFSPDLQGTTRRASRRSLAGDWEGRCPAPPRTKLRCAGTPALASGGSFLDRSLEKWRLPNGGREQAGAAHRYKRGASGLSCTTGPQEGVTTKGS